jgi:outer membrane protein OmpA-like peptidoglycan-associated protein
MGRLIGRSRRERLITAGTALAIVIAIIAVIVLVTGGSDDGDSGSEAVDQAAYAEQASRICVQSKQAVAVVANRAARRENDPAAAFQLFAAAAADVASQWRKRFAALDTPSDRQEAAAQLQFALAKLEGEAGQVSLKAKNSEDLSRLRARLAAAGARVETAIEPLRLGACAKEQLVLGRVETG